MKKLLLLKSLLVVALLGVGVNAWADTETITVLSENYESYTAGDIKSTMQTNGWTFQNKNKIYPYVNIVQGTGTNTSKYLSLVYSDGGAERNQYWLFPSSVTSALNADNWTFTFDGAIAPGGNSTYELALAGTSTSGGFNANTRVTGTTTFFDIVNASVGSTSFSAKVGGTAIDGSFTLTSGTWYKFTIMVSAIDTEANTATVYAKITSYDGETTVFENTQSSVSTTSIGTLKGLTWWSPKTSNSTLLLDNVVLSKEVDASVVANPTYTLTGASGTSRKFTLACETSGTTIYYATSELEKGDDGWTEYASEVTTAATTIYVYAEKGTTTSDIISFATGAGTEVTLNAPTIIRSSDTSVTITSNQSDKVGSPAATIYYTYGGDPIEYTGAITVAADATITAWSTATGYTNSGNTTRVVALFPSVGVTQVENTPTVTSDNASSHTFASAEMTTSNATYAALLLKDETQWGTNVYMQTDAGKWGIRNGSWYIQSTSWLMMKNMKAGDIIVAAVDYKASSTVNATYSEKYSYSNRHAYIVDADGDVELGFTKPSGMDYFYGIYAWTHNVSGTKIGAFDNSTSYLGETSDKVILAPGESYNYQFKNYNSGGNGNYNNYLLAAYDRNDVVKAVVRADNFEVVDWKDIGCSNDFNWTDFVSKMDGATVDMTVSYSASNVLNMTATITTNEATPSTWTYSYTSDYTGSGISLSDNIKIALSVDHAWLDIISEGKTSIAGNIASSGYSSLASAYGLDFANATGLTNAFVVTNITKDAVMLSSVDELPANSGVILKGIGGAAYSIPVKADASFDGTNKLHAAVTAYDCAANEVYILQSGLFHLVTAASTVPAGKAYLLASDVPNEARSLMFAFDDETTGIDAVSSNWLNGDFYNLQGQRVDSPKKGLYIVNGRKVLVK